MLSNAFLFVLFFSGNKQPENIEIGKYQRADSLSSYLEKLYEATDESPYVFSNNADSLIKTLWRKPKTEKEHIAYLDFVLNIAYYLLQQGQIPLSTRWYEVGLQHYQQHKQEFAYEVEEFIFKPLGNNYVRLGDYDKAVLMQKQAITNATKDQKKELLASLYSNLAISYFSLGNFFEVQKNCDVGLSYSSFNPFSKGLLYNVKANAFYESGVRDSALLYNQLALKFLQKPGMMGVDASWIATALELYSKLLTDQKKFSTAITKLNLAEKILSESFPNSRQRDKSKLKVEKGKLFEFLSMWSSCISECQQGLAYFNLNKRTLFPDNTVTALYAQLASAYSNINADSSLHYYELAITNDYYCNQLITTSANSIRNNDINSRLNEKAIAAFLQQFRRTGNKLWLQKQLWLIELSKGRKLLNEVTRTKQWVDDSSFKQQQLLFRELRYDYFLVAETTDSVRIKQVQQRIREQEAKLGLEENRFSRLLSKPSFAIFLQKLDDGLKHSVLLSYFSTSDSIYAIKVEQAEVSCVALSADTVFKKLSDFNLHYFKPNSTGFINNPKGYFQSAYELYTTLFPFKIAGMQLIISPDGLLHQLSFEALSTDGKEKFLGEENQISYVYSFLQYINVEKTASRELSLNAYSFGKSHLDFAALPNSVVETNYLEKEFSCKLFKAENINGEDFVNQLESASLLHIATHSVANDSLQQPYLVLKNRFYLSQLQYTVTVSPLVVLTACETAAGQLQLGEGASSIARAFISKGVQAVVATRWKVDDAIAPAFVKNFYTQLKRLHSPAAALHQARKIYLQSATTLSQKDPLLWAGFSFLGVDLQVDLQTKNQFEWRWLFLLVLAPLAYFIFRKK